MTMTMTKVMIMMMSGPLGHVGRLVSVADHSLVGAGHQVKDYYHYHYCYHYYHYHNYHYHYHYCYHYYYYYDYYYDQRVSEYDDKTMIMIIIMVPGMC